jgi:uncharacterized protein
MRQGFISILVFSCITIFLIDLYAFKGIKMLTAKLDSQLLRSSIHIGYWILTAAVIILVLVVFLKFYYPTVNKSYLLPFFTMGVMIMHIVPKLLFITFLGIEDLGYFAWWGYKKIIPNPGEGAENITRGAFLTKLGLVVAGTQLTTFAYGIAKGRFNFRVEKSNVFANNLPDAFDGFTIAHISDLHLGSFFDNHQEVEKGIKMLTDLKPDIIFVTGDLVNNFAWEIDGWEPVLSQLKAKYGVYSILGNHDYGDYVPWNDQQEKVDNLKLLIQKQKELGFDLLLNENRKIAIGNDFIELIGIENWGKGGFAKYGDLNKAMENTDPNSFKILLSHDPSHWDEQVLNKTDINLTLSGHTHGMQYGVEIGGFKWSPVKYRYPRWGGIYQEKKQYLNVNRGFGYIGFPGRVGMPPEISFIKLSKKV